MSAMHHDTSPDLKVVASKLKDVLGVMHFCYYLHFLDLVSFFYMVGNFIINSIARVTLKGPVTDIFVQLLSHD